MIRSRAGWALLFLMSSAAMGQEVVGWRRDGSGKYPEADPPITWGRVSKPLQGLRSQANRPAASDTGTAIPDGIIREWLVLSPAPAGSKVEKELSGSDAELAPAENEKIGDAIWKKVSMDTAWLDFTKLIGAVDKGLGVAATNVYSETGGPHRVHITQLGPLRIQLNGKVLPAGYGRYVFPLVKGWNRLLIKVAPHQTGWACTLTLHAGAPGDALTTNLAWSAPLPGVNGGYYGGGMGCGAPILVGNRIYLLSEPHDLICLNKEDGQVLWVRTNSFFDAATEEDRKKTPYREAEVIAQKLTELNASLSSGPLPPKQLETKVKLENELSAKMQEVDPVRYRKGETPDVGFSGYTPIFDGKRLYLWLGSGVTACYELDGTRAWIRADPMLPVEHGFSSSPILIDGKIVVFMRDLFAFEAKSGNLVWRIPVVAHEGANPGGYFHGTPIGVTRGGVPLIVLGNGTIVRASDGKVLLTHPEMGNQAISSPVVEGDRLFETGTSSMRLFIHTLPGEVTGPFKMATQTVSVATTDFPCYYMPWHMASPLVHEGLAYLLNNSGVLTVVDLKDDKLLYQRMVDVDQFQTANEGASRGVGISPALAGKHLFLFGNNGAAMVLEPGRTFKPVAKNKIENVVSIGHWGERQERFVANPVFEGNRIYVRGEGHLYAIAATGTRNEGGTPRAQGAPSAPTPKSQAPGALKTPSPDPELAPTPMYGWRRNGTGHYPGTTPPLEWDEKKNVRWTATVGAGHSSPVIADDRVFVVSEPGTLHCLGRKDGKELWKADLKNDLPAPPRSQERARATPVTDGRNVFVTLCNGYAASYTIDGKRNWSQAVEPPVLSYGPSASPVLFEGQLLVDAAKLTSLDAATGKVLWKAAETEAHYGTPAVLRLGGVPFAVTAKGAVVRLSDGTVMARDVASGLGGDQAPSPLVQGDVVYFAYKRCSAVKLALSDGKVRVQKLWEQELPGDVIASPLLKDGLLFAIPSGTAELRVLNAASGEILLEKTFELRANLYPSLALAGGRLYLGNDQGHMLVLEPTREAKELHRNELPEGGCASPAFAGSHVFLRSGDLIYCIGP